MQYKIRQVVEFENNFSEFLSQQPPKKFRIKFTKSLKLLKLSNEYHQRI